MQVLATTARATNVGVADAYALGRISSVHVDACALDNSSGGGRLFGASRLTSIFRYHNGGSDRDCQSFE
jgi:hypothetical protein